MTLYRGDSIPKEGETDPLEERYKNFLKYFLSEGLMTRSFGTGRANDLDRSLCELVAEHTCQIGFYSRSIFLSFSTSDEVANVFMEDSDSSSYQVCPFSEATHFIWRLELKNLKPIRPGLFGYIYTESGFNVEQFLPPAVTSKGFNPQAHAQYLIHRQMKDSPRQHSAYVIDVNTFLKNCDKSVPHLSEAIGLSSSEREWLVCPTDPLPGGGYEGRIYLSEAIFVHNYCKRPNS